MNILGAGLAGCLAGAMNQRAEIFEACSNTTTHKALLRFRSPDIGEAVGVPFKKVNVYKGIWHNDRSVNLSPRHIALYSRKVSDTISYRSICNQKTVERWVAPMDFHDILREQLHNRIEYNFPINHVSLTTLTLSKGRKIISTLPINILAKLLKSDVDFDIEKNTSPIKVSRYSIPDCDVFMTYYFTDPTTRVYRASIDGSVLIIESMWDIDKEDIKMVSRAFGLTGMELGEIIVNHPQPNGKIAKINDSKRRNFILDATLNHGIYSLGRFATWRNLVLDDVYRDIIQIKQLINKDRYEHKLKL